MEDYIPEKGDFITLTFDPQSGHEQKGRRPALVVSNTLFNQKTGLSFVCPITNTNRNIPLHVTIPEDAIISGVIMVDQMKSVDYRSRNAKFIDKVPIVVLSEALAILDAIIYDE